MLRIDEKITLTKQDVEGTSDGPDSGLQECPVCGSQAVEDDGERLVCRDCGDIERVRYVQVYDKPKGLCCVLIDLSTYIEKQVETITLDEKARRNAEFRLKGTNCRWFLADKI